MEHVGSDKLSNLKVIQNAKHIYISEYASFILSHLFSRVLQVYIVMSVQIKTLTDLNYFIYITIELNKGDTPEMELSDSLHSKQDKAGCVQAQLEVFHLLHYE